MSETAGSSDSLSICRKFGLNSDFQKPAADAAGFFVYPVGGVALEAGTHQSLTILPRLVLRPEQSVHLAFVPLYLTDERVYFDYYDRSR